MLCVRSQFVTTPKLYWVRTLKVQTMKFVERGLERLGLGHRTVVSHGIHEGYLKTS